MENKPQDNYSEKNQKVIELKFDIITTVQKLWRNRKFIILFTITFACLGFLIALLSPNIYTSSCTIVPQTGQKNTPSNLGGLAALAGINLSNLGSSEVLSPNVYSKIISNVNFQKELLYSEFHFSNINHPITLYSYYSDDENRPLNILFSLKKYTIGLPGFVINSIRGNPENSNKDNETKNLNINTLTLKEKQVLRILTKNIALNINNKDGYLTITTKMPEPLASAELAQYTLELLQKYIIKFKKEKASNNLDFIEKSFFEAKSVFENKQKELAIFRDANKGFATAIAKTQEEKLMSEYSLYLNIYTEIAKQREQAKIAVNESTPILTVIEPVVIPTSKSEPRTSLLVTIYTYIGVLLSSAIVLIICFIKKYFSECETNYPFKKSIKL